jgi:aryl-alcohol dehydrogenase-like predicted oxidoreductase
MDRRTLGAQGLEVGTIGLGCMGMTFAYSGADEAESRATIRRAVELGVTLFDTADIYGPYTNEELVGDALGPVRDAVVIATKFGNVQLPDGTRRIDGSPQHVRRASHQRRPERVLAVDPRPGAGGAPDVARAGHRARGLQPAGAGLPDRRHPAASRAG